MAKTKSDKVAKATKPSKVEQVKAITSVKGGAITKPSQTPKAKSQEVAKQVAVKADKASKKSKKVKEPTPSSSEDEEMDRDAGSSDSSESEEEAKPAAKTNGAAKVNGKAKTNGKVVAKEESDSSDSSDSSEDEKEVVAPKASKAAPKATPKAAPKAVAAKDESESDSEDEEDSEGSDSNSDDEPKTKGPVDAKALNGALKKVASKEASSEEGSEDSGSDDSGSDENSEEDSEDSADSDSSSDESEKAPQPKKRKAEAEAEPTPKKAKTEKSGGDDGCKNLFVGSLSWNVDEEWLAREFEEFGELSGVRVIMDRSTGRSKGFGYVEFVNGADAAKAMEAKKGAMIDGREINLDFSQPKPADGAGGFQNKANDRAKTYGDQPSEPSDTLFVGNIAFSATEDILGEEFGKHGGVIGIRLPTDPDSGNPKGFGYVQFSSIEEATVAYENMKGAAICGRPIRLDYGRARTSNGDSPRGGRGGDRGGRGRGGARGGRGGFGDRGGRGGRGGSRGGRGGSTNRGGFGDFQGKKMTF